MIRAKMLLGLALMVGAMAVAVTPALASFSSNNGTNTGGTVITAAGVFEVGGVAVKCAAAGISATWTNESAPGTPAIKGPDARLAVTWQTTEGDSKCSTEIAGIKAKAAVKPCNLTLEQIGTSTTEVHGGVETECIVKAVGCEIKVPKASSPKNTGLKAITVANEAGSKNLNLVTTAVVGVTATLTGATCPKAGETSEGKLSGFTGTATGDKLV